MKANQIKTIVAIAFAGAMVMAFSSCNGGAYNYYPNYNPTIYDYTTNEWIYSLGTGDYEDYWGNILFYQYGNTYYDTATGTYDIAYNTTTSTKDTDLQKSNVQKADQNSRAQLIANHFQMSFNSALQLAQLSDRVKAMVAQNQMTSSDRAAVANSALKIAGLTPDQVNAAIAKSAKGDDTASEQLLSKAAQNLEMPSASNLRDQLLPALGFSL